ncbi:putative leader peptide [Amycolatopsis antarctica]
MVTRVVIVDRVALVQRRHVDLLRVSSALCRTR